MSAAATPASEALLSGERDPAAWPFSVSSPWNLPLLRDVRLESEGSACSRALRTETAGSDVNAAEWSHPTYVARPTDPKVRIWVHGDRVATIRVPRHATPARPHGESSDGHMHIVDEDQRTVHELWRARRQRDGSLVAESYSTNDLYGPGVGHGGERAYGGSAIGGLIRVAELRTGIRHALALALPKHLQRRGPVWPATEEDSDAATTYAGAVPLGQRVALPRELDLTKLGLGPAGLALGRALQDYGAYDVDSAADFSLYAEPAVESELGSAREDWPKLRVLLRCVALPNRGADAPAPKAADFAVPLAPPLRPRPSR